MEKISKKQVEEDCQELKLALLETIDLDEQMIELVQAQKKARYRLNKAREIIHFIKIT
jgi:hypothetical protein